MKIVNPFAKEKKLKSAFKAIKIDMDLLEERHSALKNSTNEWMVFLNRENQELKTRVRNLERRLAPVEKVVDYEKFSMLREV